MLLGLALLLTARFLTPHFQPYTSDKVTDSDSTNSPKVSVSDTVTVFTESVTTEKGGYEFSTICDTLKKGESIFYLLLEHGIDGTNIHEMVNEFNTIFNVKRSFPGDVCTAILDSLNTIQHFEYRRGEKEIYVVEQKEGNYTSYRKEVEGIRLARAVEGEIRSSLYEAMTKLGLGAELIFAYADIFAWDVDFYVDTRVGDRFRLLFEECCKGERVLEYGPILAAAYLGEEGSYTAILFQDSTGYSDYYDLEGQSMRKTFLKSPFKYGYKRISSGFSWSRLHPIRKVRRPHLGIDYAAPIGTPVISTADGVVEFRGRKGGFGKYVKIKHGGGMYTTYGHLSRYGRGIRKGARVKQGQVIGYVGSTGLSTGPHLDYRFMKNGRYVNPLRAKVPAASPVKKEFREEFQLVAQGLTSAFDLFLAPDSLFHKDTLAPETVIDITVSSIPESLHSK